MGMVTKYHHARKRRDAHPGSIQTSLQLAMGFLIGAEMYDCAAAVAQLYKEKYGNLPEHMADLESE
jgi:hypothetical protein